MASGARVCVCVCVCVCVWVCPILVLEHARARGVCMCLYMRGVCAHHKVTRPLNKFERMTHWDLPPPSISADGKTCSPLGPGAMRGHKETYGLIIAFVSRGEGME